MKTQVGYTAIQTFDSSWGEAWTKYIEWSQLDHLKEVVSLDCSLCASLIDEFFDEDWNHKAYEDIFFDLFGNLDYLLTRIKTKARYQVIATIREPKKDDISTFTNERFTFKGFDLLEDQTRISALTNCGGFDLAFQKDDISESGLVTGYEKAYQIRELLLKNYPNEHHANCAVWALWKMK